MAKVTVLIFIIAISPLIFGYPLEDEVPSDAKRHELKVNPLVAGQKQSEDKESSTEINGSKDGSTDQTYVEETYIEVLLPGSPQTNSSTLEALLNSSNAKSTSDDQRSKRDSSSKEHNADVEQVSSTSKPLVVPALYAAPQPSNQSPSLHNITPNSQQQSTPSTQNRQVRDTSTASSDSKRTASEPSDALFLEDNKSSSTRKPLVAPALYSQNNEPIRSDVSLSTSTKSNTVPLLPSSSSYSTNKAPSVVPAVHAQHENLQRRPVRDSSNESGDDSKEDSSSESSSHEDNDFVAPSLYNLRRSRGASSSEEKSSSEESGEKRPQSSSGSKHDSEESGEDNRRPARDTDKTQQTPIPSPSGGSKPSQNARQ